MFETKRFDIDETNENPGVDEWLNSREKNFDVVGYQIVQALKDTTTFGTQTVVAPALWITIKYK